jgi:response regulator RpfG family c-di-GMP phosphodiesterase
MKTAKVLCVDDEPNVLEGLSRILHRKCIILTATSGAEALKVLAEHEHVDVIVTDMRMPEMNGATLLAECRKHHPETVRLLLTGHADLESAIKAVNEGAVFRFLTKPCPPPQFLEAVQSAVEKHRLEVSERVLFDKTVLGSVRALTEVIALVHPGTLASTSRQLERARKLATYFQVPNAWHVEVAAILSQAGYVVLPNDLMAKTGNTSPLKPGVPGMLTHVPLVLARVLSGIPRLEDAQTALKYRDQPFASHEGGLEQETAPVGARILKVLTDLAVEETRGSTVATALKAMRARPGLYDPAMLDALTAMYSPRAPEAEATEQGAAGGGS